MITRTIAVQAIAERTMVPTGMRRATSALIAATSTTTSQIILVVSLPVTPPPPARHHRAPRLPARRLQGWHSPSTGPYDPGSHVSRAIRAPSRAPRRGSDASGAAPRATHRTYTGPDRRTIT